jgi:hypothetical protein
VGGLVALYPPLGPCQTVQHAGIRRSDYGSGPGLRLADATALSAPPCQLNLETWYAKRRVGVSIALACSSERHAFAACEEYTDLAHES